MIRPRFYWLAIACLVALGWVGCGTPASRVELDEIPVPIDLESRDRHVVEQYTGLRARLDAASAADAPREELIEALLDLGNWHHNFRDHDLAVLCYRNGERLEPDNLRWPYYLGRVHGTAGDAELARESFDRVLELNASYVPALVHLAELEWQENRAEVARTLFERVLDAAPQSARAHFGLAQIALDDSEPTRAIQHLEAALEQQPDVTAVHYALGRAYRAAGDADAAAAHFEKARIDGNSDVVTLALRDPLMERVRQVSRGRANTRVRQAEKLFEQERYDEAVALLNSVIESDGDQADIRFLLGLTYRRAGRTDDSLSALRRALELKPDHGTAHYQIGIQLPPDDPAVEHHLRRALEIDPGHRHAGFRLGEWLRRQGRLDEAIQAFESAIETNNTHPGARFGLVASLIQAERWEAAHESAVAGLDALPTAHQLRHLLARMLASSPVDALRDGERAVEMARVQSNASMPLQQVETIAMALAEVGRFDDAVHWQEIAVNAAAKSESEIPRPWIADRLESYRRGLPARGVWAEAEPKTLSRLMPSGRQAASATPAASEGK